MLKDVNHRFFYAAYFGPLQELKELNRIYPLNLNIKGYDSRNTLLHAAVATQQFRIVDWLCSQHVKLNVYGECDFTPLHYALKGPFYNIAKLLVAYGAAKHKVPEHYRSYLHCATFTNNLKCVELAYSLDPSALNKISVPQGTPLHNAASTSLEIVQYLVEKGALVNLLDWDRWSPLHIATSCGKREIVEYLISVGAFVDVANNIDKVPRDIAKDYSFYDIVEVFNKFRPNATLEYLCVETLYHAHVNEYSSFSLTQKDMDKLPNHLSCRLEPYIEIESVRPTKKIKII